MKMMTSAKLFVLGEERELLWIGTNYYRYIDGYGVPYSNVEGGFLTLSFVSQEGDDVFCYNMLKEVDRETERMEKGEIHFFMKGDEDIPVKKYKFNDAYLIYFSEVFCAEGSNNMRITLIISPAIQNYAPAVELVKWWNKSWVPPVERFYSLKSEEDASQFADISGYFYTKEGKYLGKIGSSNNVYITDDFSFSELEMRKNVSKEKIINFTEKYKLTNVQMLDRANWVYAEGGYKIPKFYAYSMENAFKTKYIGNSIESDLYKSLMKDNTGLLEKEKYFSGGYVNQTGKRFWVLRNSQDKFNQDMINCVGAVISSKLFPKDDPTGGTNAWLGYKKGSHVGEYYILSEGSKHFFLIYGKSKTTNLVYEEYIEKRKR